VTSVKIQAKHIPYGMVIDLIRHLTELPHIRAGVSRFNSQGNVRYGWTVGAEFTDMCKIWDTIPPKVIQTKLDLLERKGMVQSYGPAGKVYGLLPKALYEVVVVHNSDGSVTDTLRPIRSQKNA